MSKIKNYIMDVADAIGKKFDEVTEQDFIDIENKAQSVFTDLKSTHSELEKFKKFLKRKSTKEVSFYDEETGSPKFKIGSVMVDGNGTCYLIVA